MISTGSTDILSAGGGYGGGFGGGWGGIAPIGLFGVANGLFGRDGRGDNCGGVASSEGSQLGQAIYGSAVLGKLGDIEGAIPLAALQTQNSILEQTNSLTNLANQSNLAQLAATSGVKDAVQNGITGVLLNANQNTQSVLGAICNLSSKIDQNRISELESQLSSQRFDSRSRDIEVNVNQSVVQAQAQAQQQAQFGALFAGLNALVGDIQAVKQGQVIFNSGTMAASGTQASANTKVA